MIHLLTKESIYELCNFLILIETNPITTRIKAKTIFIEKYSPFKNIMESMDPDTGIINLYIVISPALLYLSREYHMVKAMAERKAA